MRTNFCVKVSHWSTIDQTFLQVLHLYWRLMLQTIGRCTLNLKYAQYLTGTMQLQLNKYMPNIAI